MAIRLPPEIGGSMVNTPIRTNKLPASKAWMIHSRVAMSMVRGKNAV